MSKPVKNWWIDAVLMVGYLFCFYVEFTGVAGHEWLGVGLTILTLVHLWLHWDWVKAITLRFFKGTNMKNRWYYVIDFLIVLGFIVILETGLIISTWFNLAIENYLVWLDLHIYSSFATLGLLVLKVGLHWRWVVNTTRKIFGTRGSPTAVPVKGAIPVPASRDNRVVERREFIAMMGVVSLGSVLAVSNVLSENRMLKSLTNSALAAADEEISTTQTEPTAVSPTRTPTTVSQKASSLQSTSTVTIPQSTPTTVVEVPTQAPVVSCTIRCNGQCSFPGRCRRYIDQNNNGKCDLGECL